MLRSVVLALVAGFFLSVPHAVPAQAPTPATETAYAFCTVTDTSSAQAKIWASSVLLVEHAADDAVGFRRGQELAAEFLDWVRTQGGQGDKNCSVAATAQELATLREQNRATWDKRVYFIKIGDWRDVAWTPKPWTPSAAATADATRYFLCHAVQTDLPDRSARARSVATDVFARSVPRGGALEVGFAQAQAYARAFQPVVDAHGVAAAGSCMAYDTLAEAQYAQQQQRRLLDGFNLEYTELAWTPTAADEAAAAPTATPATTAAAATAPSRSTPAVAAASAPANSARAIGIQSLDAVTPALQRTLGMPSVQGVFVAAVAPESPFRHMDVLLEIAGQAVNAPAEVAATLGRLRPGFQAPMRIWREGRVQDLSVTLPGVTVGPTAASATVPAAVTPATPAPAATRTADNRLHCTAFVTHAKSGLHLRTPIWEIPAGQDAQGAMSASLQRLIAAVVQANPDTKWMKFPPTACHDNSGVFAGETFCVSTTYKHFGGAQIAAQFCNPSKEMIGQRNADMDKSNGGARVLPWPPAG